MKAAGCPAKFWRCLLSALLVSALPLLGQGASSAAYVYTAGSHSIRKQLEEIVRCISSVKVIPQAGRWLSNVSWLTSLTHTGHFIVDVHPHSPLVAITAGFSRHGFKFARVIGEILADLVTTGPAVKAPDLFPWAGFSFLPAETFCFSAHDYNWSQE